MKLIPYLNFMGQAKEAMEFYHSVLGGDLTMQSYGEANPQTSPEEKDLTMHAELKTDSFTFFASDGNAEHQVTQGDNVQMSLVGEPADEAKLKEWFTGLSAGGQVTMPLAKAPWGDTFGMFTDKYGIHWMVNISASSTSDGK